MPFTGSHPAAVVPFFGTALPASALVIGSMSPDIAYFLPLPYNPLLATSFTHGVLGVVTVDLVLGALVWLIWHGLLSAPALAVAPRGARERLVDRVDLGIGPRLASLRQAALVAAGIVVGGLTHIAWDAFTHDGRWGVRHIPLLTHVVAGHAVFAWAQYASGVLGAAVLGLVLLRWWRSTAPKPVPDVAWRGWVWTALGATAAVATMWAVLSSSSLHLAAFRAITRGGAVMFAIGVILAVVWHLTAPSPVALRARLDRR